MRSAFAALVVALSSSSLCAACSSSSAAPVSTVDAAIADAAPYDAPPGPNTSGVVTCNTMTAAGPEVVIQVVDAEAAPVPAGGTIVDGTYQLNALTQYGGNVPYSYDDAGVLLPYTSTITLTIAGTSWQTAGRDPANASYTANYQVVPVTGATNVELDETCPDGDSSETISYTATPTSLTWFVETDGVTTVSTFTKD